MRELSYFVFTSGEEGVRGLDWGIKFASSVLGDKYELDSRYRDLLQEFGLSPSLERPDSDVGILLLPYRSNLLIYILPGYDTLKRLNTIAVACNIPSDISSSLSVREISRRIWSANDIAGISEHGSFRPDVLKFPDEAAPSGEYPFFTSSALMTWPTNERGYLSINGNIRELKRKKAEPKKKSPVETPPPKNPTPPRPPYKWIIAACLVSVIAGAGIFMMMKPEEARHETPKNEQPVIEPSTTKITSNDKTQAMKQKYGDVTVIETSDKEPDIRDEKHEPELKLEPESKREDVIVIETSEDKESYSKDKKHEPELKPESESKRKDVFAVNRDHLIDELRRLYDKQTFSPRISLKGGKNVLDFSTRQEKLDLNWKAILPGGSSDDKKFFIDDLRKQITFESGSVFITFFEPDDRVKKGNVVKELFDVYLGIFADQMIKHYRPINGGGD